MFSASIVDTAAVRSCGRKVSGACRGGNLPEPGGGHRKYRQRPKLKPQPGWSWRQKLGSGRSSVRPWRRTIGRSLEEILANRPAPQKGEAVFCQHCLPATLFVLGGELLTSTEDIVGRWKKYFEDLLNPTDLPSSEEAEAGDSEVDSSITRSRSHTEVVRKLLGGKAPGGG
ncbi:hypothetical protein L3Q82_019197 [Scortum barcoo]|uniref:Uncharacterized protein n=1 Tax=Scortum barcoo TaxID=214431 RepID=A0ACB8VGR8_9TELE|nr:hypothetical protein L3Q82_019197 [Scortum barcoo]